MATDLKDKTQKVILMCSKRLENYFKSYNMTVDAGQKHISFIVAHQTSLDSVSSATIDDTDTYEDSPEIKQKLAYNLKCSLNSEEEALDKILKQQDTIFASIIKECDKVFSTYQNAIDSSISLEDLTHGDLQYPICKKVDAFDTFKKRFNDNHLTRRYCLSYYTIGGDVNKLPELWDTSKVENIQKALMDVNLI